MKIIVSILFWFSIIVSNIVAQPPNGIKKIEIYGIKAYSCFWANIDKKELKSNRYGQYIRVINQNEIARSNIDYYLARLVKDSTSIKVEDFRIMLIIHRFCLKKEIYYISISGGILKGRVVFKMDYDLLAAIYSFFPDDYFTDFYNKNKELF